MKYIDNFLNSTTMYRLALYCLTALALLGIVLAFLHVLPFSGLLALLSLAILMAVCHFSNLLFGYLFKVQLNTESDYITAVILFLILAPPETYLQAGILTTVAVVAMASKYILNIKGKHIFNPAAVALFFLSLSGLGGGSWWVASGAMLPLVLVVAFLMVKKIRRADLFFSFILVAFVSCLITGYRFGLSVPEMSKQVLLSWPLIFFGSVMLTEPQTTPPTRNLRIIHGALVGILFGTSFNFGFLHNTPELALIAGNVFAYWVSPKQKLFLKLKEKLEIGPGIYDFVFDKDKNFNFTAGQYLEWTLAHPKSDLRGVRRFFTIASSPTEDTIRLGAKFYEPASSFKQHLLKMNVGDSLVATQLSGDFTLPKDPQEKLVFIAGGIGVTPFRSMIKYLSDTGEKRSATLFYSTKTPADVVYKDVFDEAQSKLGLKTVYAGIVTEEMIKKETPDYLLRTFYLSGPHAMVSAFQKTLAKMGVKKSRIKTDFFPGYA